MTAAAPPLPFAPTASAACCAPSCCSMRAVEDKAITEIVEFHEDVGLRPVTDGEFRSHPRPHRFSRATRRREDRHPGDDRPARRQRSAGPELDPASCDDVATACGDALREAARSHGDDPNELPHRDAMVINKVVAQKPAGMTLAMHRCRGNFKSTRAAAGNCEPVAEALLAEMSFDAYFMACDDERCGDFRPLRCPPGGCPVAVGAAIIVRKKSFISGGETTTQGRVFWISLPGVGSSAARQISLRCGGLAAAITSAGRRRLR